MRSVQQFFFFSGAFSMLLLAAGLYKPWIALWWQSTQNRRKVLHLYGSLLLLSAGGYVLLTVLIR